MSMKLTYWGVRGSLPSAPTPKQNALEFESLMHNFFACGYSRADQVSEFVLNMPLTQMGGFGTATTSVEVTTATTQVVIDGGSGIFRLSQEMMKGPARTGQATIHIFLTHFHWDHLIGLPFFAPLFIPGNQVHFYAVQPELETIIRGQFKRPCFPVPFEALPSKIHFHTLKPREVIAIGDLKLTPYQLDHPDACWGYRVENGEFSYAHCVDTECTRSSREAMGLDLPLYQKADLMYFDAQYTLPELAEKANWGHSAAQLGIDIAFREHIKHVIFAHHDPGADAAQIHKLRTQTKEYYEWRMRNAASNKVEMPTVQWDFAFEGLVHEF
jgi:phosphoribosyl 1,2-cyclic phosphodiesterase